MFTANIDQRSARPLDDTICVNGDRLGKFSTPPALLSSPLLGVRNVYRQCASTRPKNQQRVLSRSRQRRASATLAPPHSATPRLQRLQPPRPAANRIPPTAIGPSVRPSHCSDVDNSLIAQRRWRGSAVETIDRRWSGKDDRRRPRQRRAGSDRHAGGRVGPGRAVMCPRSIFIGFRPHRVMKRHGRLARRRRSSNNPEGSYDTFQISDATLRMQMLPTRPHFDGTYLSDPGVGDPEGTIRAINDMYNGRSVSCT